VSDNVDITYTAANYGKAPGDKESLPVDAAKKLVQAGVSTKTAAKAAGVDPDAS
jgi:hypothetical protein